MRKYRKNPLEYWESMETKAFWRHDRPFTLCEAHRFYEGEDRLIRPTFFVFHLQVIINITVEHKGNPAFELSTDRSVPGGSGSWPRSAETDHTGASRRTTGTIAVRPADQEADSRAAEDVKGDWGEEENERKRCKK
jgi:hypothetical protein